MGGGPTVPQFFGYLKRALEHLVSDQIWFVDFVETLNFSPYSNINSNFVVTRSKVIIKFKM